MKQKSRTEYSVMNTSVAFVAQVSAILMGFFTRVVFTRMLSEGYVGINGLFTDILNILSLSELGVGTAITYALYAPIAKGDIKKQQILMRMFRTFYRMTALFVMGAGLCLIPFLDVLPDNCRICTGSRDVPYSIFGYSDERPPGRGSSGTDLLSVSVKFGGIVSVDL